MSNLQEIRDAGFFTATGNAVRIPLRADYDLFKVWNYTQMATQQNPGRVVESHWHRGFLDGYAKTVTKTNATDALNGAIAITGGFTRINTSAPTFLTALATTNISNAAPPVLTMASTAGLIDGDTVRITGSTACRQIAGMDFTIDNTIANTSTELIYMIAPGSVGTAGVVRKISTDPMFYPRNRYITNITQAASAVVTLSVTHGYVVGEKVFFSVSTPFGMTQINGKYGEITAINTTTNTITVNIDTTGYTAWAWPATTAVPFTFPQVVPAGEIPTIITASNQNVSGLYMELGSAVCGSASDVMYWEADSVFRYNTSIPSD